MESNKLDIAAKEKEPLTPTSASYKPIREDQMNGDKLEKPRSSAKEAPLAEPDGADEKMLSNEDQLLSSNSHLKASDVKFINNDKLNGDAKLDIGGGKDEFVGLTKEELMKFANDPFWVRLRWFLFISFWLLWAGLLIAAIMIIVAAPKCSPPEPKTWWEEGPLVELSGDVDDIEIASLQADNIAGIIVPYPDDTYKPVNDTNFGSFLQRNRDWNVILQLNPTVSDRWFQQSITKSENFSDYYIWAGQEGVNSDNYPNNWLSSRSQGDAKVPAWKYAEERKQFYLAPDDKPMLNFRNPEVRKEFLAVLKSFIEMGVDGFSLEGVPGLLVDPTFANESPLQAASDYTKNDYNFYSHYKTQHSKEIPPILKEWRDSVKAKVIGGVLMLNEEVSNLDAYKFNGTLLIDLPRQNTIFNKPKLNAVQLAKQLNGAISLGADWPAWKISNKDYPKTVLETFSYLLKGTTILEPGFKVAAELKEARKSPSIMYGTQSIHTAANNTVLAYVRVHPGNPGYLVALNPTQEQATVNFPHDVPLIPEEVSVQYFSENYNVTGVETRLKQDSRNFPISPESVVVMTFVPGTI